MRTIHLMINELKSVRKDVPLVRPTDDKTVTPKKRSSQL